VTGPSHIYTDAYQIYFFFYKRKEHVRSGFFLRVRTRQVWHKHNWLESTTCAAYLKKKKNYHVLLNTEQVIWCSLCVIQYRQANKDLALHRPNVMADASTVMAEHVDMLSTNLKIRLFL
jgi:hypothetical protein